MTAWAKGNDVVSQLVESLPEGVVVVDPRLMEGYRHDWTRYMPAGWPIAVVRAESASQVQTTLQWASAQRVSVVPRGAGTSLAGGATAVDGCVVVCTERMTALEIDPVNRVAVAEPGLLNVDLKQAAATHGLWYPPDPSSFRIASIGGNVATNAGGLCCLKYGVTADYVLGLDVVLPDGRLITLGGPRIKDVAGLSLLQLFVGSEGTLGIITRIVLRLVPQQDPAITFVAYFPTPQDAGAAVVSIGARLRPSLLELLDRVTINLIEDYRPMGLDRAAGAMLIGQSDAPGPTRSADLAAMVECCRAAGAREVVTAEGPVESDLILQARRAAGPAVDARGPVLIEDVCVPVDRLPLMLDRIQAIARAWDVDIPVAAHAGDGNLHPAILYTADDDASVQRAQRALDEIMRVAVDCGGTITGEHGVGRAKRDALPRQLGPDVMDLNRRIRRAIDPRGIMNPGVLW
jgi:glycolate oxidase